MTSSSASWDMRPVYRVSSAGREFACRAYPRAMAVTRVRGVELHHDTGGTGPILVWGHGLTSSRAGEDDAGLVDWAAVRRRLRVLRYDARGHGESGFTAPGADYGWDAMALDQLELAATLGLDRYVAGGASMGAATALHAACIAPDRIRGLVLMIPPTAWETRAAQADLYRTMAAVVEAKGVEPLIAAGAELAPPDPFAGSTAWKDRSARALRAADPERLAVVFRGAATADFPSPDQVAAITVPALILAWTGDPGHPVTTAERLATLLPDSSVQVASTSAEVTGWSDRISTFVASLGPVEASTGDASPPDD